MSATLSFLLVPRKRWTWMRKLDLVVAINKGLVSPGEAEAKCELPAERIAEWQFRYAWAKAEGLKYRRPEKARPLGEQARAA